MDLIIVESPTKARTLGKFLGSDFVVEATYGHVRDLPEKKIGVKVGDGKFEPEYVVTKKQEDRIDEIKKYVEKAKNIYLATDPDREGEAIAWHTSTLLSKKASGADDKFKRIVFHEITEKAIKEALSHPREIDTQMVDAQQARRILDRLVGYKLSPLLWRKVRKGLSAGRVQSVAVRLIVEKEKEIEAFSPEEYWVIQVEVAKQKSAQAKFLIMLSEFNGEKIKVGNGEQAGQIKKDLEKANYLVLSVDQKEARRSPPPPFTTSTLQQAGTSRFGWSAKKTMQVAQSLYEQGFITYHRTDSTNMAAEALVSVKEYITGKWGKEFAVDKPRLFATKSKVAQEAHEAIRPTDLTIHDALVNEQLNRDEAKLYDLIWKRFVGCQMAEAELIRVNVMVSAEAGRNKYGLTAKGETVKFWGWLTLFNEATKAKDSAKQLASAAEVNSDVEEEERLPELAVGEKLDKDQVVSAQKFTQPPARYNDASLIKTLEEMGIGRPSTYAPILSTIQDRQYVERVDKRFKPTPLGIAVNDFLTENFSGIVDYQFTAKMEDDLDEVANGKKKWQPVLSDFYDPFEKTLATASEGAARVKVEVELTGDKCPTCSEGDVVVRIGKFGRFLACSRYPECKYRANYVNKIGVPCPKCGGDVIVRRTRSGKTFYGCSNYPKCDFASWTKPTVEGLAAAAAKPAVVEEKVAAK